jgi:hypothetical protein
MNESKRRGLGAYRNHSRTNGLERENQTVNYYEHVGSVGLAFSFLLQIDSFHLF